MARSEQKEQTRQRIVEAAARGFRSSGYGLGVDGLARQAGVTSGAFYVHFGSKSEAFAEAVRHGLQELEAGVRQMQAEHGRNWWPAFVRFYLGFKRTCDLAESCSLQSLTPELARADENARRAFDAGFEAVARAVLEGPKSPGAPRSFEAACLALSTLVGAVTLARAAGGTALAAGIAEAAGQALLGRHWAPETALRQAQLER